MDAYDGGGAEGVEECDGAFEATLADVAPWTDVVARHVDVNDTWSGGTAGSGCI